MNKFFFYGGPAHKTYRDINQKSEEVLIVEGTEKHRYTKRFINVGDRVIPVFTLKKEKEVE